MGEITSEDRAFARLALKNNFLTRDQVKECFRVLRNDETGLSRFDADGRIFATSIHGKSEFVCALPPMHAAQTRL